MFDSLCNRSLAASHSRDTKPPCYSRHFLQKSHWDKTNKGNYHLKLYMSFIVTFALQHGSFVPGEWLAAKGSCLSFYRTQNTREDVYSQVVLILCVHVNLPGTESLGCRSASELHIGVNSGLKYLSEESIACSRGSGGGE